MVGTSIGSAPCAVSRSLISPAWSLVRGTSTVQPYRARLSHQFSLARLATVLPMVTTTGDGALPSVLTSRFESVSPPSVDSTERCAQVVPDEVTTHGVVSARPYSISVRAASATCEDVACRISGPGPAASAPQSTCGSRTSATVCDEPSGSPAYVGTAQLAARPGTISKCRWVRATAFTSVITASTDSGSPATSRTTSVPVRASATSVLATSAGSPSAGRMSGPTDTTAAGCSFVAAPADPVVFPPSDCTLGSAGAGPDTGGKSLPISASTGSGTSGSMKTRGAFASTVAARVVSRAGSPGPEPTNMMRPGLGLRPRVVICVSQSLPRAGLLPRRRHEFPCPQFEQLGGHREPELSCPIRTADTGRADHVGSVQRRHAAAQRQLLEDSAVLVNGLDHLGDRPHRRGTTRLQFGEQGTLRGDGRASVGVVELRQQCRQASVPGAALDGERPLSRRRQHLHRLQRLGDVVETSQSGQTRPGYHNCVQITAAYPVQPGI